VLKIKNSKNQGIYQRIYQGITDKNRELSDNQGKTDNLSGKNREYQGIIRQSDKNREFFPDFFPDFLPK